MVSNVPERFKNAAVAFDEEPRHRLNESSGSEHSPRADSPTDLFDLVASFVEGEGETRAEEAWERSAVADDDDDGDDVRGGDERGGRGGYEYEDALEEVLEWNEGKRKILGEVQAACKSIGHEENSSDFKRGLVSRLRKRGLDAGLCKCRWEKTGSGEYLYVDVNMDGVRYIVEVSLAGQFEVARPTDQFDSLLKLLPPIFVGTPEELKEVVRLLSAATGKSLRSRGLAVPPWRKTGYVKAKWFSSYKRSTSSASKAKSTNLEERVGRGGFEAPLFIPAACYCREAFATKMKNRTGLLTEVLAGRES